MSTMCTLELHTMLLTKQMLDVLYDGPLSVFVGRAVEEFSVLGLPKFEVVCFVSSRV